MYRNYDGNRSTFGETSVRATSTANADNLSVFAAERASDHALTVMVVSKVLSGATSVTLGTANFTPGSAAQVWQLTASNAIARLADVTVSGQGITTTVPAQSITLFVLPASTAPVNQPPVARATATPASGTAPLSVAFDGRTSTDADGTIASYAWTFGDGGTATGSTATHLFQAAASYVTTLKVTDNQGATGTTTVTIGVAPGATAPAAPSGLSASAGAGRVVTLSWIDNASNETGFYVERAAKTKTLQFSRIATLDGVNVRSYALGEASGTWVYRVQAFNSVGVSAYSNNATLRVK